VLALIYATINVVMLLRTFLRAPKFFAAHKARGGSSMQRWRFFVPALAYLMGLFAVFQTVTASSNVGVGFFAPIVMMLAASTRTAWDLLAYVGQVRGQGVPEP
jgi:hypothetical protein